MENASSCSFFFNLACLLCNTNIEIFFTLFSKIQPLMGLKEGRGVKMENSFSRLDFSI